MKVTNAEGRTLSGFTAAVNLTIARVINGKLTAENRCFSESLDGIEQFNKIAKKLAKDYKLDLIKDPDLSDYNQELKAFNLLIGHAKFTKGRDMIEMKLQKQFLSIPRSIDQLYPDPRAYGKHRTMHDVNQGINTFIDQLKKED